MYQNCPEYRFYCNSQKITRVGIIRTLRCNYRANDGFQAGLGLCQNIFLAKGQRIYVALRHNKAQNICDFKFHRIAKYRSMTSGGELDPDELENA